MVSLVKMRKVDLLLYHREQEKFLDDLRAQGVVHITSEQPTESAATQELREKVQLAQRAVFMLMKVQADKNIPASKVTTEDVPLLLTRFETCESKKDRIEQEFAALQKDNSALEPWGNFDHKAIKRLAESGVMIRFYSMPEKKFAALDRSKFVCEVVNNVGGNVCFVVIYRGEEPVIDGAEEVRLPDISYTEINAKASALEIRRSEVNADIETLAGHIADIQKYRDSLQDQIRFEQARMAMQSEAHGKLLKLSGWLPLKSEAKLKEFLKGYPAYATFRDPVKGDDVPVNLKSGRIGKLFEPILELYMLPNYRELNFAPLIAPFFILFVGLCLGDLGYGALVFLIASVAYLKAGPKMKPFMMLGIIFGVVTMCTGLLLNGFFGAPIFGGEAPMSIGGKEVMAAVEESKGGGPFFATGVQNALLAPLNPGSGAIYPAMGLAMFIGFVQIFFGMLVKSYIGIRNRGIAAGLEPLSLLSLAFGAVVLGAHTKFLGLGIETFSVGRFDIGAMLLLVPVAVSKAMVVAGIVLLLLSNNLDKKFYMRPLTGIWALYNFITGFLSNILSYLRLFALGLAGGLLGAAVNQIAFMIRDAATGHMAILGIAGMVVIMVGGHALNMSLACLSSFVHPLRLTFVEFYGAVGFNGGGKRYQPFAKVEN